MRHFSKATALWRPARKNIGQPIFETHPHLFKNAGELTPGVSKLEYQQRRMQLIENLPSKSAALIPGYGLRFATNSIFYPFHQQTDLFYLTGFNQPDSALLLLSKDAAKSKTNGITEIMFCQPFDPHTEIWDGPRAGIEGAIDVFGLGLAHPIGTLESRLKKLISDDASISCIFTNLPLDQPVRRDGLLQDTHIQVESASATHSKKIEASPELQAVRLDKESTGAAGWFSKSPKVKVRGLTGLVDEMRLIKSSSEFDLMRQSGRIAGRSFVETMRKTRPGMTEHQIHATLEYHAKMQGATGLSYVPVVAGGLNALTLHYVNNTQALRDGDLLLVDCGCEYNGYASDITRTWPINGTFTKAQGELYQLVLDVQKEIIKRALVGQTTLDQLQLETFDLLQSRLTLLFKRNVTAREMHKLYPHHVSHYIGLDVHDTPKVSRNRKLVEGMTITIEPGIYIPDSDEYGQYRGIGIRIEDDIYISEAGPIELTAEAPKEILDIEQIMAL